MPCLTFHRLRSVKDPLFAECWALYEAAFPYEERRSLPCHAAAMAEQDAFHCLRLEEEGKFAGIAFYWKQPQFIYAEHLAISPKMRRKGLGLKALDYICGQGFPVILEIEPVQDEVTEGRRNFYRRAGFYSLIYHHLQPLYHRGDAPMALTLLSYPYAMNAAAVGVYEAFMQERVALYTEENLDSRA